MVCIKIGSQFRFLFSGTDIARVHWMDVQEKILHILLDSEEKENAKGKEGEGGFEGGEFSL